VVTDTPHPLRLAFSGVFPLTLCAIQTYLLTYSNSDISIYCGYVGRQVVQQFVGLQHHDMSRNPKIVSFGEFARFQAELLPKLLEIDQGNLRVNAVARLTSISLIFFC